MASDEIDETDSLVFVLSEISAGSLVQVNNANEQLLMQEKATAIFKDYIYNNSEHNKNNEIPENYTEAKILLTHIQNIAMQLQIKKDWTSFLNSTFLNLEFHRKCIFKPEVMLLSLYTAFLYRLEPSSIKPIYLAGAVCLLGFLYECYDAHYYKRFVEKEKISREFNPILLGCILAFSKMQKDAAIKNEIKDIRLEDVFANLSKEIAGKVADNFIMQEAWLNFSLKNKDVIKDEGIIKVGDSLEVFSKALKESLLGSFKDKIMQSPSTPQLISDDLETGTNDQT